MLKSALAPPSIYYYIGIIVLVGSCNNSFKSLLACEVYKLDYTLRTTLHKLQYIILHNGETNTDSGY